MWIGLLIAALAAPLGGGAAPPGLEPVKEEVSDPVTHWVSLPNSAWLALHRYPSGGPAVILCHGISSNHRFWDLAPGRSLARTLHAAGYDVWNMDLRGHGAAVRTPEGRRQRPGWTIDTYGTEDLPAAIAYVRAESGQETLRYVGHSMGGMVLAVYLAHSGAAPFSRAVAVGSPMDFRDPDRIVEIAMGGVPLARGLKSLPTPMGAKLLGGFRRSFLLDLDEMVLNPENMTRESEVLAMHAVVSPLTRGEIRQFDAVRRARGEFVSIDGSINYREALGEISLPMLFIAGRADRIVSPDRVFSYYEALGTEEKAWLLAGRTNGMHGDYGHLDMGIGNHVEEDIFPAILDWLEDE